VNDHTERLAEDAAYVATHVWQGFVLGEPWQHVRDVGSAVHMEVTAGALATIHAKDKQVKDEGMNSLGSEHPPKLLFLDLCMIKFGCSIKD